MKAAYEVHNLLGLGFLESIYEAALTKELSSQGLPVENQVRIPVFYTQHSHIRVIRAESGEYLL